MSPKPSGAKMLQPTKDFLQFLAKHPGLRRKIAAPRDKALLYAGKFFRESWKEVEALRRSDPGTQDFVLLPDILKDMPPPQGTVLGTASMYHHLQMLDKLEPWLYNGFIAWRAVSGIYAANATGKVRFYVGYGIRREPGPKGVKEEPPKVLAATEVWVLLRNKNTDPTSREMVAYLADCVRTQHWDIGVALT